MKLSIRSKFMLPVIMIVMAGSVALAWLAISQASGILMHQVEEQLRNSAEEQVRTLSGWVSDRRQEVVNLSRLKMVQDALGLESETSLIKEEVEHYLKEIQAGSPYLEGLFVANSEGIIVASSNEKALGLDIQDRAYYKEARSGQPAIGPVVMSRATNRAVFHVAAPVISQKSRQFLGVIFYAVEIAHFSKQFIEPVKIGQSGYVYVYAPDGLVISHPDPNILLKLNINELSFGQEMDAGFLSLDLTLQQEEYFTNLLQHNKVEIMNLYEGGMKIDESFQKVINKIKRTLGGVA